MVAKVSAVTSKGTVEQRDRGTINLKTWSEQSDIGRYSKHCVVLLGKLSDYGSYLQTLHCVSALRWCKRRTQTCAIGVDSVKNYQEVHGGACNLRRWILDSCLFL